MIPLDGFTHLEIIQAVIGYPTLRKKFYDPIDYYAEVTRLQAELDYKKKVYSQWADFDVFHDYHMPRGHVALVNRRSASFSYMLVTPNI